jgi:hypothetical protein
LELAEFAVAQAPAPVVTAGGVVADLAVERPEETEASIELCGGEITTHDGRDR